MVAVAKQLITMGFKIVATRGTAEFLTKQGAAAAGLAALRRSM
jgi:AICAR transformylase/IMP cyclohydrolase PurH